MGGGQIANTEKPELEYIRMLGQKPDNLRVGEETGWLSMKRWSTFFPLSVSLERTPGPWHLVKCRFYGSVQDL